MSVEITVNGKLVEVVDERLSLLDVLRGTCGIQSVKMAALRRANVVAAQSSSTDLQEFLALPLCGGSLVEA